MPGPTKQPRAFSVFYGDETYLLDREHRRALKWPGRAVIALDGSAVTEVTILEALGDVPLDEGDGTVVVVDNANEVKVGEAMARYASERDPKDRSSVLVAICRTPQLSKGWAEVARSGRATAYVKLKPWEREKIQARVDGEAAALGLKLEDSAFDVLFELHGEQTALMVNELKKAAYLLEAGGNVTQELILSVCGRRRSAGPWTVSEAAFAKNPKRALRAIALLMQDKGEEALIPVVAGLMKQLETVLLLRRLLDQRASVETMGAALGLHPYRVQKDLPTVKKHTVPELLSQMKKLCELETQVKGPSMAKRTLVELAVLSLAA